LKSVVVDRNRKTREKETTEKSDGVAGAGGDEEDARGRRSSGGGLGLRHESGE